MQRAFLLPFPIMNHPQQKYAFQNTHTHTHTHTHTCVCVCVCVQVKVYYTGLHKLALTLASS